MNDLEKKIEALYYEFFEKLGIDKISGEIQTENKLLKFATYPFVGSEYINTSKKILFVGYDIGQDETPGSIQTYIDRRVSVESPKVKNPHIAGTFATALYFLKNEYNWEKHWELFNEYPTCYQAYRNLMLEHIGINPLSHIALTNFFKFVEVDRINRTGDGDRKTIKQEDEFELIQKEIELFNPKIIILQGVSLGGYANVFNNLKAKGIDVYLGYHPANRKKGYKQPEKLISTYQKI